MDRRTVLRGTVSGIALSTTAGCIGASSDMSEEEGPQIDPNESYGFAREGNAYQYQANGQFEVAFGDSITSGGIELWAKGIEWGSTETTNVARIPFVWRNHTNSTLRSHDSDAFALYEAGTNTQMDRPFQVDDPYTGPNQVQPGQADIGNLGFDIPEEYTSLDSFRLTLYVPASDLTGNKDLDVAWTPPTGNQAANESSTGNATNSS